MIRSTLLTAVAASAILSAVPALANHHGAALSTTQTIEVDASPAEVWARIGAFQDASWHPAVFSAEGDGEAAGDSRLLTLGAEGGPLIAETLTDVGEHSYSYVIDNVDPAVLPVVDYSSTLSVSADGDDTIVTWSGTFNAPDGVEGDVSEGAVAGVYMLGLEALEAAFDDDDGDDGDDDDDHHEDDGHDHSDDDDK